MAAAAADYGTVDCVAVVVESVAADASLAVAETCLLLLALQALPRGLEWEALDSLQAEEEHACLCTERERERERDLELSAEERERERKDI